MADLTTGSLSASGVAGELYKDNAILLVDTTGSSNIITNNANYDSPMLFMVVGSIVISVDFCFGYSKNNGTINATSETGNIAETISSFSISVNGTILTRRRYGNPGKNKTSAYSDARTIMVNLYNRIKKALDADTSDKDYKFTTLTSYPITNSESSLSELKKKYSYYTGNNKDGDKIFN